MANENQPRHRQASRLARKRGKRELYDRVLIVCEGEKTEPQYLEALRIELRLASASVRILPSQIGTEPRQIVDFAESTFRGSPVFDRIYVVFDRDSHLTYHDALSLAERLHHKLRNDEKKRVPFIAIPSVPCFELWLLLHFEQIHDFHHRDEMHTRLKEHIPGYHKSMRDVYAQTKGNIETASKHAAFLRTKHNARNGTDPYTDMDQLVTALATLRPSTG